MNQSSLTTRLGEYISPVLPAAHGHQRKAVTDFVSALVSAQTCCQAALARCFDNFEAASKRLSRLLHNAHLAPTSWRSRTRGPSPRSRRPRGLVRLSLDWTTEGAQHLLIASLRVGTRAAPVYWRAYHDSELKQRMSLYQREFARHLS